MMNKVLISKKEIKMGEQRRCKQCNAPIDEGNLCSGCRMSGLPKVEKWTKADFAESSRQMSIKMDQMAADAERYRQNPN